ncbi:hypothetical protein GHT06_022595 [Daphnia sinensis]|uniref:Uncharacterized protein n=1 Tax=Daphnia sinensis TaxID=1820382 RepID=A0AAD5KY25_9CRUS|nr:hypothetical protein GHT06_022595 [Daphnia sinensis]
MGRIESLRIPPFQSSPEKPSQYLQGVGDGGFREPVLAQRTMVPVFVESGSGCGESSNPEQEAVDAVLNAGASRIHPDGAAAIRERIVERSFQSKPTLSEIFQYMGCERGGVTVGFLGDKRPIEFDSIVKTN